MTPQEIRALTVKEIEDKIDDAKEELFNLRFQKASGQLDNAARFPVVRREVARLKTILREKQLAAELVKKEGRNA